MDDGAGVITEWKKTALAEEDWAVFDALLLNWRHAQQWEDLWKSRFESFGIILEVWLPHGRTGYKIFAARKDIYELVMFAGVKGKGTKSTRKDLMQLVETRIKHLQQHPGQYCEYRIF